jgi:hypothetical protein
VGRTRTLTAKLVRERAAAFSERIQASWSVMSRCTSLLPIGEPLDRGLRPDDLVVDLAGAHRDRAELLTHGPASAAGGRTGGLTLSLPTGLAYKSLLLLRQGDEWLDFRYFPSPTPGPRPVGGLGPARRQAGRARRRR